MNEFYESILNIKQYDKDKTIDIIKNVISEELKMVKYYVNSVEGLCKIICMNIKNNLENLDLKCKISNIKNFGGKIDHEFIMLSFKDYDCKVIYVLIDPTYSQFLKCGELPYRLSNWPTVLLKDVNPPLLDSLLNKGFSIVDNDDLLDYSYSFGINFTINNVIIETIDSRNKKK